VSLDLSGVVAREGGPTVGREGRKRREEEREGGRESGSKGRNNVV